MCTIDWGLLAATVGAFGTLGLFVAAIYGFIIWRSQFFKSRDHDLARRILGALSSSEIAFDELRTPHGLLSDSDEPVAPPTDDEMPGAYGHRKLFARYKARAKHVTAVRKERAVMLLEAIALWDDEQYSVRLGELFNELAELEDAVTNESVKYAQNMDPGADEVDPYDHARLFAPLDAAAEDETAKQYFTIKTHIVQHLRTKLRME